MLAVMFWRYEGRYEANLVKYLAIKALLIKSSPHRCPFFLPSSVPSHSMRPPSRTIGTFNYPYGAYQPLTVTPSSYTLWLARVLGKDLECRQICTHTCS